MDSTSERPGIRLLDRATSVAMVVLVVLSCLVAVLGIVVISGRGSASVGVTIEPPYTIGFDDDRSVVVSGDGASLTSVGFERDLGLGTFQREPEIEAAVTVDPDDLDSRLAIVVGGAVLLGLSWAALVILRRIVRSARVADPFDPVNVRRIRWLAAIVLMWQLVLEIGDRVLTRTLESELAVNVSLPRLGWISAGVVALLIVALAEVFSTGSELRSFERETI
ncbi:hypothetical protein BDK89_1900 [Ilumatobacter fluminis]|uniref:DUF2975 family protein n=1 Tax=Ilumatobacter fluminis TaxID=467091 RepID=A0A4R7I162_9ACTN|nr:DUF2975 domain-containing protein [Ilumatobacter fluminis]TDT16316.1 hypothetical protein BDK89_1900 [Ilumatobacter fluminis]